MIILSSAKISEKHRVVLKDRYPAVTFIFCNHMDEAKQHIAEADVLMTYGEDLTTEIVQQSTRLKWIMVLSAGIEKMPFKAIADRDILVTNARGIHQIPMAEYAISMLLQVCRQSKQLFKNEENKQWNRAVRMKELTGKTMLIAGTGAIGQEVARLAKAFRMTVYGISKNGHSVDYVDKTFTPEKLHDVLPESDVVVSVLPSTPETIDFFTYNHFRQLPDHAVFLNMGRGDAVREETILKAVQEGEIAHAILDVFEEEPLPSNHPLWEEDNVTVTPHISGISPHYQKRALKVFEDNLHIYLNNRHEFVNQIDINRGY